MSESYKRGWRSCTFHLPVRLMFDVDYKGRKDIDEGGRSEMLRNGGRREKEREAVLQPSSHSPVSSPQHNPAAAAAVRSRSHFPSSPC